jgi:hypothetical protein
MTKTYDPACETLAEHFLQDNDNSPSRREELSLAIQEAVEDWLFANALPYVPERRCTCLMCVAERPANGERG